MTYHKSGQAGDSVSADAEAAAVEFFWGWMNDNAAGVCEKDDAVDIVALLIGLHEIGIYFDILGRDTG